MILKNRLRFLMRFGLSHIETCLKNKKQPYTRGIKDCLSKKKLHKILFKHYSIANISYIIVRCLKIIFF